MLALQWALICLLCGSSVSLLDDYTEPRRLRSLSSDKPKEIQQYEIFTSQEIEERLQRWATHYPDLTRLTTSQEEYDLPRAGLEKDCPFIEGKGCPNSILTIQDFVAHPEDSDSSNRLPEVLWSGEVHGNEQVGPTSVMQAAELMLQAASCLALPRLSVRKENPSEWAHELEKAKECRQDLKDFGVTTGQIWWLGRLVSTRRIVVIPTANSLGYFRKVREEGIVDPNRDFPYDYKKTSGPPPSNDKCMKTIAARTLNEVFREHMFQLSLTFHGGMEVIGYEWGAPSYHKANLSPDDTVQSQVAAAYSRYAGGWKGTKPYDYGAMNSLVYPVRGGMEDWAYAGSWDSHLVIPCKPTTFGGYPRQKTIYNNSTLRVLNMLVETSNNKIPTTHLGSSWDLIQGFSVAGNGHISRNIRLALLSAELVQPWLSIRRVNEIELTDDIIPLMERTGRATCQEFKAVTVPGHSGKVVIEWSVGGSLHIDDTKLWYAKWDAVPELNCIDQPPLNIQEKMTEGVPISDTTGKTAFASTATATTAHFSASMDVSNYAAHDKIVVLVSARVDQDWATQPKPYEPANKPPQSHMANVRTNPNWFHKTGDKVIQGRLDWFSVPLTIEMGEFDNSVETVEMSTRIPVPNGGGNLPPSSGPTNIPSDNTPTEEEHGRDDDDGVGGDDDDDDDGDDDDDDTGSDNDTGNVEKEASGWSVMQQITGGVVVLILLGVVALVVRCVLRERVRYGQRSRVRNFIDDKSAPTPGARHARDGVEENGLDDDEEQERYMDEPEDHHSNGHNGAVEMGRY